MRQQNELTGRTRNGKGMYQLFCASLSCNTASPGIKGNPSSPLYHTHKCLHTSQMVSHLTGLRRFKLTKTHQLVAETMPFVQQPQLFTRQIRSAYHFTPE